jgi:hypothetical protein
MNRKRSASLALMSANVLLAVAASQWLGCASAPSEQPVKREATYEPQKVASPIDAGGAAILYSAHVSLAPGPSRDSWGVDRPDANVAAIEQLVLSDLSGLELFTNATSVAVLDPGLPPGEAASVQRKATFELRVHLLLSDRSLGRRGTYPVTLAIVDVGSGMIVKSYSAFGSGEREKALGFALDQLTGRIMDDFGGEDFRKACMLAVNPDPADLEGLIAMKDLSVAAGSAHNRALIAANTLTLPGILREKKTADLVALKVKIEQSIFDLAHRAEVDKEKAEGNVAAGLSGDDLREQSLICTERIGILKPMLAALNEEIASRSK